MRNTNESLRAAPVEPGAKVKGLEWSTGWGDRTAVTPFGEFRIHTRTDGNFDWFGPGNRKYWASSEGQAKAAAQADYERRILSALELLGVSGEPVHADDLAVDRFAIAMKAKLAKKRAEGRGGWDRKDECTAEFLSALLRDHVNKGDPLDVGNLAMMLHQRSERITPASPPKAEITEEQALADEILAELVRARTKFPGKNVTFAALVEEVGELATATFEEGRDRVRKEAVQVAVMAMRMVLDGDHTFDNWRADKGLDPLTAALSTKEPGNG